MARTSIDVTPTAPLTKLSASCSSLRVLVGLSHTDLRWNAAKVAIAYTAA